MRLRHVVFFVPSALLFAELGTAFPEEGGPYICTRLAFGRLAGAINNFPCWVTNPVWLGGTLALLAAATFSTFFLSGATMSTPAFFAFTLVFIWVGVLSAIFSFRIGKWVPTVGAWSRFVLLGFFTLSVVIYAIKDGVTRIRTRRLRPDQSRILRTGADPAVQLRRI
jgi:amino acid transporter